MKKQKGFTIIELIAVIVILGVLSITATIKYMEIQKDAKHSVVNALASTLNSAIMLVYAKSEIQGTESGTGSINIGGSTLETHYGYPSATERGITKAISFDKDKWKILPTIGARRSVLLIWKQGYANNITNRCYVQYTEADNTHAPAIIVDKDACYLPTTGK